MAKSKNKFYVVIFGKEPKILDSHDAFAEEVKKKPNAQKGFKTREAAEEYIKEYFKGPSSAYYVVHTGKNPGIYLNVAEYEEQVKGVSSFVAKKLGTIEEVKEFLVNMDKEMGTTRAGPILNKFMNEHDLSGKYTTEAPSVNISSVCTQSSPAAKTASHFYAVYKGVRPGIYTTREAFEQQVAGIDNAIWQITDTLAECQSFLSKQDNENDTKINALIQKTDVMRIFGKTVATKYYVVSSNGKNKFYEDDTLLRRALLVRGSRFIAFNSREEAIEYCIPSKDEKGLRKIGEAASSVPVLIPPPGIYVVSPDNFKLDRGPEYWKSCSKKNPNTVFAFTDGSGTTKKAGSSACVSFFDSNMYAEKMMHTSNEINDTAYISEARAAILAISKAYSLGAKSLILFIDRADVISSISSKKAPLSREGRMVWEFAGKYKTKMAIFLAKVPAHKDCKMNNIVDGIARAIV